MTCYLTPLYRLLFVLREVPIAMNVDPIEVSDVPDGSNGDSLALKQKLMLQSLCLEEVLPAARESLCHDLWQSSLKDFGLFRKISVPNTLAEAVTIVELDIPYAEDVCEHGGGLATAKLRWCFFECAEDNCMGYVTLYRQLQDFLEKTGLREQSWRLCCACGGSAWKAKAVGPEAMFAKATAHARMDRWAALCGSFDLTLPLQPVSELSYTTWHRTTEGKEIFCSAGAASRPKHEHEQEGNGYSQRKTKRKSMPQLEFHVLYWLMAFCYEQIRNACKNKGLEDSIDMPQERRFATHQTMELGRSPLVQDVRNCFSSETFQKVSEPVRLAQALCEHLRSKAQPNHRQAWGFQNLFRQDVEPLENIAASAVHTFATLLPNLPIFHVQVGTV